MARRRERSFLAKLTSNTVIGFFGSGAQRLLTFAITLVLARGLGGEEFGLYSYVTSYMFLFAFIGDLGVERVVTREVSRTPHHAGELIGSALVVKVILACIATAAAIVTAWAVDMSHEAFLCVVLSAVGLPMGVELVFRGYFQSRFQASFTYAITLPSTVWLALGAVLVTRLHWPLWAFFAFALLTAPVILVSLLWISHSRLKLVLRPQARLMRTILRDSIEMGGFILLFMLAMRLDQVMLHHLSGDVEVGLYAVGVRLSEALSLIPEAVLLTLFPLLVRSEHAAPERFRHTYRLGFRYLAAIGVMLAFLLTVLRHEVIAALFGAQYATAATSLALLSWNMFFTYVGIIYLGLFVAQARQRLLLLVSTVALAVNVGLNLLWIPAYGAAGAAAATISANVVGFLAWLLLPATRPYMITCLRESWRALASAAAVQGMLWIGSLHGWPAALVVIGVYPALLWILGGVQKSDVGLVQRLFATQDPETLS